MSKKIVSRNDALAKINNNANELIKMGFINITPKNKYPEILFKLFKEAFQRDCLLVAKYGNKTEIISTAEQAACLPDDATILVWYSSIEEIKKRSAEMAGNSCL